jgi:hypothetical protein
MTKKHNESRRKFLKMSAVGAAGLAACKLTSEDDHPQEKIYADDIQINPRIHNLRVAMTRGSSMVNQPVPDAWDFDVVNDNINRSTVHANMDAMARYLTQASSADSAWAGIFRKPEAKTWEQVRVALKVNCIEPKQMPKIAIVEKICLELNRLGASYSNMVVWDGGHNAYGDNKYSPYRDGNGLPAGVEVSRWNELLGGTATTYVPAPYYGNADCTADIANGNIDILVNFAVNKGHGSSRGSTTLSMKNHFGTFDPSLGHVGDPQAEFNYLIGMNRSEAIVGGNPPRQQLVVMDSIYAMTHGPTGDPPNRSPYALLMGTFGPAVDYATAKLIREKEMGEEGEELPHSEYMEQFITAFGYTQEEQDDFINRAPADNEGRGVGTVTA